VSSALSYAVWAAILVAGLVLWLLSMVRTSVAARPAQVLARMATHPVLRVVVVLTFMWFGWHLFAR
jgi:Family of unknown function (DUF6186)